MENNDNSVLSFIYNLYQFPGQGQGRGRGDTQDFIDDSALLSPFRWKLPLRIKISGRTIYRGKGDSACFFLEKRNLPLGVRGSAVSKKSPFRLRAFDIPAEKTGRLLTRYREKDIIIKTAYNSYMPTAHNFSIFSLSEL